MHVEDPVGQGQDLDHVLYQGRDPCPDLDPGIRIEIKTGVGGGKGVPADVIHAQVLVLGGLDLIQGLDPDLNHVTVTNLERNRAQIDLRGRER